MLNAITQKDLDEWGIHIGVPRTGTTSLTFLLGLNRWHKKHMPRAQWLRYITPEQWDSATKYTVVRNPYSRAVSLWGISDKKRHGMTFAEFAERRVLNSERECYGDSKTGGWLFWSQDEWIPQDMDYVGRFEEYQASLQAICSLLGKPKLVDKLTHENHGNYDGHWREHYTAEIAEMVATGWASDFARFGYSTELIP